MFVFLWLTKLVAAQGCAVIFKVSTNMILAKDHCVTSSYIVRATVL